VIKSIIILILFPFLLIAQNNDFGLEEKVTGIIVSDEGTYLILNKGVMKIQNYSIYTEYYRQIYNDSTLINPNMELKDDFSLAIIPFLTPNKLNSKIDFTEPMSLGFFLHLDERGEYEFTSFGESFIDSIRTE
jgi:hypothetical protein